jgi:hypothetical protein
MTMSKKEVVIVKLPHLKTEVELPPELADVMGLLLSAGEYGVTAVDLIESNHFSPSERISRLRKLGAIIVKQRVCVTCDYKEHHGVANYVYKGWI